MIYVWLFALAAIVAMPFAAEAVRAEVTERRKAAVDGDYADLPKGRVFYRWNGPQDGPIVVCIHGLTTPSYVWDGLIPHLVDAGFRVLSFDLYGRGFSDRPPGLQDAAFFEETLNALLQDQNVREPVTLFGNSMGSAIAAGFAARNPSQIRQLVLFVPAGMGDELGAGATLTRQVPGLGDWLFHLGYPRSLRKSMEPERTLPSTVPGITDRQLQEIDYRGFLSSVLSSLRGILAETRQADHQVLRDLEIPVTAIWGGEDDVIPIAHKDRLANWNPQVVQIELPEAGHGLIYTHTDELWSLLEPELRKV